MLRLIGQRTIIIFGTISELRITSHQRYAPFRDFSRSRNPEACRGSRQWKRQSRTAHLSEYQERLE